MERLFAQDVLSKRERLERTLAHQPVDRVALHEQLSYSPAVIAHYADRSIVGFKYTVADICEAIRRTLDTCFPPVAPRGTKRVVSPDGFVIQHDNWTSWRVSRPFGDVAGARQWLQGRLQALREAPPPGAADREAYRDQMLTWQDLVGETVIINYTYTGFCSVWDALGLELFVYFSADHPQDLDDYLALYVERELQRIHAVADEDLSPVILIAEDFATKQGPIFSPQFLACHHFPHVAALTAAWHEHGVRVLYHSDGNYEQVIPELMACGVDGFYCLEPGVGMDIVRLKATWPQMTWAGGLDGVDLMERGAPEQVWAEVHRLITQTDALHTGGLLMATSSEINPPIPAENYLAMVEATGEMRNDRFRI